MQRTSESGHRALEAACFLSLTVLLSTEVAGPRPAAAQKEQPSVSQDELDARRKRIRQFFKDRLARLQIVATTVTPSGQVLDWIPVKSQTADGTLATPPQSPGVANPGKAIPPESTRPRPVVKDTTVARTEVQLNPALQGPVGTVPVVRFEVEKYLASTPVLPADPSLIFGKLPPPAAPDASHRYYVAWQQDSGPYYGTWAVINVWDTVGPFRNNASIPKDTSVAQAAVTRPAVNRTGNLMQSVEAGKLESAQVPGEDYATFFVAYTTNGYTMNGSWLGGTNNYWGDGFIQYSSTVSPGMMLTPTSTDGGRQVIMDVAIRRVRGNWWIVVNGEPVGYYPYCRGGSAPNLGTPGAEWAGADLDEPDPASCPMGTLFSEAGLRDHADRVQWYGEVFDSWAPAPTQTDMGSGQFASAGVLHAAYFRDLLYFHTPVLSWFFTSGSLIVTDPACYSGDGPILHVPLPPYDNLPDHRWDWSNAFFYGGPGAGAPNCN